MPCVADIIAAQRLVVLAVAPGLACTVVSVDLTGKACPCVSGYICDERSNTCVRTLSATETGEQSLGTSSTAGATSHAFATGGSTNGPALATSDSGTVDVPAFTVTNFQARWATPNTIRWEWVVDGDPGDFSAYEVILGLSEDDVRGRTNVVVFDGATNPELDRFYLPRTTSEEPVEATITDGLVPFTEYFAQLVVTDTTGTQAASANVAVVRTGLESFSEVQIFADAFGSPPGVILPPCYAESMVDPAAGTTHFEYTAQCALGATNNTAVCATPADPAPACYENLRWQQMQADVAGISAGDFVDAYVEFALAVDTSQVDGDGPAHVWWSQVRIDASGRGHSFSPLTFRADGEYRTYQVKLLDLGLTHATLAGVVEGLRVGGEFAHGATVRVDEVYVRW